MKRAFKKRLSESADFRFWLVTIAIFLMGFLFAYAFIFALMTQRCVSFGDYWLESEPGLYGNFAWIFGLLFVWNLLLFVVPLSCGKATKGKAAHFLLNGITLLVIGYALLRLHDFVIEYEAIYKYADAEWNVTEEYIVYLDACKAAKPFLGRWSVNVEDPRAGFPDAEMVLSRDLTFQLLDGNQEVNHYGRWESAGYYGWPGLYFYYRSDDQYRRFEILGVTRDRLALEQTWAYVGDEEIEEPVKVELLRLPELGKPESAFDINWEFVFDRSEAF